MSRARPLLVGLTGSIGMGKSTTAKMFAEHGLPVWDADQAVARLYGPAGAAVEPLARAFPGVAGPDGVDRDALKAIIAADPATLARIEAIVHPLVQADRADFVAATDAPIVILDIPLLFETGAEHHLDAVVVVSAPADLQRARVLERSGMTEAQLDLILSRQMPDAAKRARADFIVESTDMETARRAVDAIVQNLRDRLQDA